MIAVVALGSNQGNRERFLAMAVERVVALPDVVTFRLSSLYETIPIGPPQPLYLNAALSLDIRPAPLLAHLMHNLLRIESELGRVRGPERNLPRTIDLDILWTNGPVSTDPFVTVPHPRLCERAFALAPLLDVEPDSVDPEGVPYATHWARTDRSGIRLSERAGLGGWNASV
jgi:2-amino-4-hydroxy-6-hydroxymethyldihydropteridine diphosphokinase